MLRFIISILVLLFGSFAAWHLLSAQRIAPPLDLPPQFRGNFLAIADADMIATAYANGILNKEAGVEDTLHYVSGEDVSIPLSSLHVSNSVISWPAILEWHPNYNYAYVAETRGIHQGESQQMTDVFSEFPKGQKISVVDYSNPQQPQIIQEVMVGTNLQNVSINASGDLLVAGSTEQEQEMVIMKLVEGKIEHTYTFSDPEIDYEDGTDGGFRTLEFHPEQDIIAANLNGKSVAFYQLKRTGSDIQIERMGESLTVGKKLSVGNWHPNGNFFLISDVAWGEGTLGAVLNGKGRLISIRFDTSGEHEVASSVKVGLSPEGFDLSPNGRYAIAVNMHRTYGPKQFWFVPGRTKASLSLISIDPNSGQLVKLGKAYGFRGALPEDAIFDQDSNSIAVAVYQEQDENFPDYGWIDFWEIRNDQLVKTNTQLKLTRGLHNLLLLPE